MKNATFAPTMYDVIIRDGMVFDGTGAPGVCADIAIHDGVIAAIGDFAHEHAQTVLDAKGKYVAPGFIDVNNHADVFWSLFTTPTMDSVVHQGVTTIVGGNSGASLAPLLTPDAIKVAQKWHDVSATNVDWRTMRDYLRVVAQRGVAVNVGTLVGHGTLRRGLIGDAHRPLTEEELAIAAEALDGALRDGALGISVALHYAHERSATHEELVHLARVVARHNGVYVAYLSDEMDGLLLALEDVLRVAREAGVRLHLAHMKAVGKKNWTLLTEAHAMIVAARASGMAITCDVYPYTLMSAVLYTFLPDWATDGGKTFLLSRLRTQSMRPKIVAAINALEHLHLENAWIALSPIAKTLSRRRIGEIAAVRGQSIGDTIVDLLLASDGRVVILLDALSPDGFTQALAAPYAMIASSGAAYNADAWRNGDMVHPRNFGTFPRYLRMAVREGTLTWEAAIAKITSLPADQFGIAERGRLQSGMRADIVIFDPQKITDTATVEHPYRYAEGICAVLVNGCVTLAQDGQITAGHGHVLRRHRTIIGV